MSEPTLTAPTRSSPASVFCGPLLVAAAVALCGGFLFGYDTAVINGANRYLVAHFHLTPIQEGTAGASAILGCLPGAMAAGFISDRFGRRRTLFICAILYGVSGLLSAFPRAFGEFLAARFIGGLGIGVSSMVCPVYMTELAPKAWRGRFGSMFQFGIVSGIFLTLFVNAQIQRAGDEAWNTETGWRWMLGAECLPALVLWGLLLFARESPRWLLAQGRQDEARRTLTEISGAGDADEEIAAVLQERASAGGSFGDLFTRHRKPLVIAVVLMAVSQFSGINAIMYYSTKILTTAGVGVKSSFESSELIGLVNLVFTVLAVALIDKAGRRGLLLVGLTIQVVSLTWVGILFHNGSTGNGLLVAILAFIGAFAMALGPVPWILCSEIFPNKVRGRAMSVATFVIWASCYMVSQTFPWLNDSQRVGPAATFFIFAICSLIGLAFVVGAVPETKGKSLEDIEKLFDRR